MLNSLYIKNFKNLQRLKIKSLERVNLITGKNNTGKSSILEALELYNYFGRVDILMKQLKQRRIINQNKTKGYEQNSQALINLFYNFNTNSNIEIGTGQEKLTIEFINYIEEIIRTPNSRSVKTILLDKNEPNNPHAQSGLIFKKGTEEEVFKLSSFYMPYTQAHLKKFLPCLYISSHSIENDFNKKLWDKIALTDKEYEVIKALKIIEPEIRKITFIEKFDEHYPVVKLQNIKQILPLRTMGDGINRILTVILALVNSEGGMLLIDEFENGLHHTVQEQLWKMIFLLAEELDIQVFATTHSEDCIRGFENVLNDYDIETGGKLIRLEKKRGQIRQVEFDKEELKVATDFGIEIR